MQRVLNTYSTVIKTIKKIESQASSERKINTACLKAVKIVNSTSIKVEW